MSLKKEKSEKLFYSIGELSELLEVNPSLIRFWEKEFNITPSKRNKKGNRLYTKKEINLFVSIYHLVKEQGYTIKGAREQLKLKPDETDKNGQIISTLKDLRKFLTELVEKIDNPAGGKTKTGG